MEECNSSNKNVQIVSLSLNDILKKRCSCYYSNLENYYKKIDTNFIQKAKEHFEDSFNDNFDEEAEPDLRLKLIRFFFTGRDKFKGFKILNVNSKVNEETTILKIPYFEVGKEVVAIVFFEHQVNGHILSLLYIELFQIFLKEIKFLNSVCVLSLNEDSLKDYNPKFKIYFLEELSEESLFRKKWNSLYKCFDEVIALNKDDLVDVKSNVETIQNNFMNAKRCFICPFSDICKYKTK